MDNEDVAATNIFFNADVSLAIGERADGPLTERDSDILADAFGQFAIGRAAEHF